MSVSLSAAIARIRRPLSDEPASSENPPPSKRHRNDSASSSSATPPSPSSSSSSSSSSQPAASTTSPLDNLLQIFVRHDGQTVVRHVPPTATVGYLLSTFSTTAADYRLLFRGRQLYPDVTLADAGVEKDCELCLSARLRSTRLPRAHQLASDIVEVANGSIPKRRQPHEPQEPCDLLREPQRSALNIGTLVRDFLNLAATTQCTLSRAGAAHTDIFSAHLCIFIESGAPLAIVKLYCCEDPMLKSAAKRAVGYFFMSDNRDFLKYAPLLVHFCKLLAHIVGRKDELYKQCRNALALVVGSGEWISESLAPSPSDVIKELLPYAQESVLVLVGGMFLQKVSSFELEEFECLMRALLREVRILVPKHFRRCPRMKLSQSSGEDNWSSKLHGIYEELLKVMRHCLNQLLEQLQADLSSRSKGGAESYNRCFAQYYLLNILTELNSFCEVFEDEASSFLTLLHDFNGPIDALLRFAKKNENLYWLSKHKDLFGFEARKNLAFMAFGDGKDDYSELHEMLIDRSQLLAESFAYISEATPTELRNGLFMEFKNEEATGPGVLREWFCLVCRDLFNPESVLFSSCPRDGRRFFLNPASDTDPLHEKYLKFSGRLIGLALLHRVQVGIVFDRVFFSQLSGEKITLDDIKEADPSFYASCKFILDMDEELVDSDLLGLTFVRETQKLGSREVIELCPGGKDTAVDSKNRENYINLLIQHSFVKPVSKQLSYFAEGFGDILSEPHLQKIFFQCLKVDDFNQILCGDPGDIDVSDWRSHTEYNGYCKDDPIIDWFWLVVEWLSLEHKRRLLFFWTSIKYLPACGFAGLGSKLHIYKTNEPRDYLPSSHTCFYRLCLPAYSSLSMMRSRMVMITKEHVSCSFGTW